MGLRKLRAYFSSLLVVATKLEPGEHGNDHGHLNDDGVDVGVYAEDFEVFRV